MKWVFRKPFQLIYKISQLTFACKKKKKPSKINFLGDSPNFLGGGPVVRVWDQEVCSLYGLRFESRGCSYDDH